MKMQQQNEQLHLITAESNHEEMVSQLCKAQQTVQKVHVPAAHGSLVAEILAAHGSLVAEILAADGSLVAEVLAAHGSLVAEILAKATKRLTKATLISKA
jgi:DNA-binding FadR family transcriptional regulator